MPESEVWKKKKKKKRVLSVFDIELLDGSGKFNIAASIVGLFKSKTNQHNFISGTA